MPTPADILTTGGLVNTDLAVTAAQAAGFELAILATLLQQESGGRNVWGSDGVPTGGAYTKGGPVTEANYAAYKRALAAGTAGRNGCGPLQLTAADWQTQADNLGGCWRWDINAKVGIDVWTAHRRRFGNERDAFVAYNGGPGAVLNRATKRNAAAEGYGDKAMTRLAVWRQRLAGAGPAPADPPAGDGSSLPTLTWGMRDPAVGRLQTFMRTKYPLYAKDLPTTNYFGDQTADVMAEYQARCGIRGADANGRSIGPRTKPFLWRDGYRG